MKRSSGNAVQPSSKRLRSDIDSLNWLSALLLNPSSDAHVLLLSSGFKVALRGILDILTLIFPTYSSSELRECILEIADVVSSGEPAPAQSALLAEISAELATDACLRSIQVHVGQLLSYRPATVSHGNHDSMAISIEDVGHGVSSLVGIQSGPDIDDLLPGSPIDKSSSSQQAALWDLLASENASGLHTHISEILRDNSQLSKENYLMEVLNFNSDLVKKILAIPLDAVGPTQTGSRSTVTLPRPTGILDIAELIFEQEQTMSRPKNFTSATQRMFEINRAGYDEIVVEPPTKRSFRAEELVQVTSLPDWAQPAFSGFTKLNYVQSRVFPVVFGDFEQNVLMCAPTGAGKTNVAMLGILNVVSAFRRSGTIDKAAFKVVYVAPMKALVQEVVQSFSARLEPLGLSVTELSGDTSTTTQEISAAQVIVTTPEKWDVVTRKNNRSFDNVRLVIFDEIHLLNDTRGPVLESLVARYLLRADSGAPATRLIGISATLPNYMDVASFLRVNPEQGLFYFGPEYRPVPLKQTYIGVSPVKATKKATLMNEVVSERVIEALAEGQVIVFVHSRSDAFRTAKDLRDRAIAANEIVKFVPVDSASCEILKAESEKLKAIDLKDLLTFGIGVHHAGLTKADRATVEDLFADRHLQVIVCTLTLAWGVNLPAHTVIIKGTQIYKPEKGDWCELSQMDMFQMLGRAGRPQYDQEGHGVVITGKADLPHYLSLNNFQMVVDSHLLRSLPEMLNAEIVIGSISTLAEAVQWLSYTYYSVRLQVAPSLYGLNGINDTSSLSESLLRRKVDIVHSALHQLHQNGLVKYDERSGSITSNGVGKVASEYYLRADTVSAYLNNLKSDLSDTQLLEVFALAKEFSNLSVREEERQEIARLADDTPFPIKQAADNGVASKVAVLLQAFISQVPLEGYALAADLVFIHQNAGRLMRSIFELALRKGWGQLARKSLQWSKFIERRMWSAQSPLRQLTTVLPPEILGRLEKKGLRWEEYCALEPHELGELVRAPKLAKPLHKLIQQVPRVELSAYIQPLSRSAVSLDMTVRGLNNLDKTDWSRAWFWIFVEDSSQQKILYCQKASLQPRLGIDEFAARCILPIVDPMPPHYFIRCLFDRWIIPDSLLPVSMRKVILPARGMRPLPVPESQVPLLAELVEEDVHHLLARSGLVTVSPMQATFLAECEEGATHFLCAPTVSGKFVASLIFSLRCQHKEPKRRIIIAVPDSTSISLRLKDVCKVIDRRSIRTAYAADEIDFSTSESAAIIASYGTWERFCRKPKAMKTLLSLGVLIIDQVHLLGMGSLHSAELDFFVSRMRLASSKSCIQPTLVALADICPNFAEVAEWLGAESRHVFSFGSEARLVPMDISVQVADCFDDSVLTDSVRMVVRCLKEYPPTFTSPTIVIVPDDEYLQELVDSVLFSGFKCQTVSSAPTEDPVFNSCLTIGVGLLGRGELNDGIVSDLFVVGNLSAVLVTKYDFAALGWKSSSCIFAGSGSRASFRSDLSDLQVLLRGTGRFGVDSICRAVIISSRGNRENFTRGLSGTLPIESNVDAYLNESLNVLVACKSVKNKQEAVDFLTWTFFYRRLTSNPNFYGLSSAEPAVVSSHLSDIVESAVESLMSDGFVSSSNDFDLECTNWGLIANHHGVRLETVAVFRNVDSGATRKKNILAALCGAIEFREVFDPQLEKSTDVRKVMSLNLNENQPAGFFAGLAMAFALAGLTRRRFTGRLAGLGLTVSSVLRELCRSLVDVLASEGKLKATLACIELSADLYTRIEPGGSALLQIPGFDRDLCKLAGDKYGVDDVLDIGSLPEEARSDLLAGFDVEALQLVAEYCNSFPSLQLRAEVVDTQGDSVNVLITISRDGPRSQHDEIWWLIVGHGVTLVSIRKLDIAVNTSLVTVKLDRQSIPFTGNLRVYVMSGTYKGCDVEEEGADCILERASKLSEAKNMLMLKYADAENLRKSRLSSVRRSEDDTNERFASDLAEVAAEIHSLKTMNYSLGFSEELKSTEEGIMMTISAMKNGLEKHQLVQFEPDEGDPVDSSRMTDERGERIVGETIAALVNPGWEYKGKIVIKAEVRVKNEVRKLGGPCQPIHPYDTRKIVIPSALQNIATARPSCNVVVCDGTIAYHVTVKVGGRSVRPDEDLGLDVLKFLCGYLEG